jgi:putative ABC transport system permease protein
MAAGNGFTGSKSDSSHFILNETAVRQAGIKDPVGKSFTLWNRKGTIIGVVKDFNYASLRKAVDPIIICYSASNPIIYVQTTGNDAPAAIAAAGKTWKDFESDFPFAYSFLDDDFNALYMTDRRTGVLLDIFAAVAIFVSCIGLFGLATYTAQVKTKEIGIRKVLGASVASLTNLLTREFLVLVLIAFLIASPIAWLAMNSWLQNYAYRIEIGWWIFLITGLSILVITIITVGFQAVRAGMSNPVKSLRTE